MPQVLAMQRETKGRITEMTKEKILIINASLSVSLAVTEIAISCKVSGMGAYKSIPNPAKCQSAHNPSKLHIGKIIAKNHKNPVKIALMIVYFLERFVITVNLV